MDAEEKQELKKNDLESFLFYRLPHYFKQYGAYILLVAALLFLGWQLWQRQVAKENVHKEEAINKLSYAQAIAMRAFDRMQVETNPENPVKLFDDIFTEFKDVKPAVAEAHISLGRFYNMMALTGKLRAGGNDLTRNEAIAKARDEFNIVINEFGEFKSRVAEAKFGLASIAETEKKFDEAKKIYEELASDNGPWAGGAYAAEAKRKLKMLDYVKPDIDKQLVKDPTPEFTAPPIGPPAFGPGSLNGLGNDPMQNFTTPGPLPGLLSPAPATQPAIPTFGGSGLLPATQP